MSDKNDPWPLWAEQASKGDLIRAIVYLRSSLASLAAVLVSMRANDDSEVQERLKSYFAASKDLDRVMSEIGGGKVDG